MKVSTEIDNNFGYEKITQLVDNIPLIGRSLIASGEANVYGSSCYWKFRTSSFKQVACLILKEQLT